MGMSNQQKFIYKSSIFVFDETNLEMYTAQLLNPELGFLLCDNDSNCTSYKQLNVLSITLTHI